MSRNSKKGFTIIEVVMVLAIAGLIFAVVFAAFPRVQRARRDGQRKNNIAALTGELEFYQSSNRGSYPENQAEIKDLIDTMNIDFNDPQTGTTHVVEYGIVADQPDTPGEIYYSNAAQCNEDNTAIETSGFSRTYAVIVKLEAGYHCADT